MVHEIQSSAARVVLLSCIAAVSIGCADDERTANDTPGGVVGGPSGGTAGERAATGGQSGSTAMLPSGPTAGLGITMMAGTSAPTVGAAGTAAQPVAGAAGAPGIGSAGQAGTATTGGSSSPAGMGGVGASGSGAAASGAAGAAGSGAAAPGDPCAMAFQIADSPGMDDDGVLPLKVDDGVTVTGVGCKQQWAGIVMTKGGRGLCTAAFITDRHLISASHCYARDGAVSVDVSAPTWDNGDDHTFQAQVTRSGSDQALDVSIIDLGKPVEWATPERRFVLHAGKTTASVEMHLYGFGSGGASGAAGTLRGIPNRATIRVTDNGRGTLSGKAGEARLCTGDSGGPAFVEKTAAVLYGINQAIVPTGFGGGRTCAAPDWTILFTNVSEYMPFIEQALGKPCERKRVDDLDVAQCW